MNKSFNCNTSSGWATTPSTAGRDETQSIIIAQNINILLVGRTAAVLSSAAVMSRGSGDSKDYFVDTKLVFRLKQFIGEQKKRGGSIAEDVAFDFLLDKFKEYVRKPQVCSRLPGGVHLLLG